MSFATMAEAFANIGEAFSLTPFDTILQPLLEETLLEQGHHKWRKGTRLIPPVLVWLVLVLTLRRDLSYDKALNWMLSGLRWLTDLLPAHNKLVEDGAISHARVKLGAPVFQVLLTKLVARFRPLPADFHGRSSVVFDGSTGTMPDTEAHRAAFGQPKARRGLAVFPQVRLMALMTNLLTPTIHAREIALHYHRRWDIEIAYDEIKPHQCATLRGQSPTTLRSKRPDLVKQEVYALAIMYNLIRALIRQAAETHAQDPCAISFLDTLQHIIDAAPLLTACPPEQRAQKCQTLLRVIAECVLARPRRPRCNPRVIKVKMSNWTRKNATHKSETRDIAKELKIIDMQQSSLPAT